MADEPIDDEDDVLEPTEEETPDDPDLEDGEDDGPDLVVIGDAPEEVAATDNSVIRRMRQELREAKEQLAAVRKPAATEIGEKPTLENCGYDADEFEAKLDEWKDRKATVARQSEAQEAETRKFNEAWQADLASFQEKKAKLAFADFDDAEETATASLNQVQQAVVVKSANDPALFLYALGKSPTKLEELAKIKDPIKMAAAVARMEGAVKVMKGRKAPEPDRPESGSASMSGTSDKKLETLQRAAEKTGDRTALQAYKKQLAAK